MQLSGKMDRAVALALHDLKVDITAVINAEEAVEKAIKEIDHLIK